MALNRRRVILLSAVVSLFLPAYLAANHADGATPRFRVVLSETEVSGAAGDDVSLAISIRPVAPANRKVSLRVRGLPAGSRAYVGTNPIRSATALRLAIAPDTSPGVYNLTVRGTGGSEVSNAALTLTVEEGAVLLPIAPTTVAGLPTTTIAVPSTTIASPTIGATPTSTSASTTTAGSTTTTLPIAPTLSVAPTIGRVAPGSATTFIVSIGGTAAVPLLVNGLPVGATATFSPNPASGSSQLLVSAGSGTVPGTYVMTVVGGSATAIVTLVVGGGLTLTTPTLSQQTTSPGTATYGLSVSRGTGSSNDPISFAALGLPGGVTTQFALSGSAVTLSVGVPAGLAPGTYAFSVTGNSATSVDAIALSLIVTGVGAGATTTTSTTVPGVTTTSAIAGFAVTVTPNTLSIPTGGTANFTVNITAPPAPVLLAVANVPDGARAVFGSSPTTTSTSMTVIATTTGAGRYPMTLSAVAGTQVILVPFTVVIGNAPGFALSATPGALTMARGTSNTSTISLTTSGGFTGAVNYTIGGSLPTGVVATYSVNPSTGGTVLQLTVGAAAVPGNYAVSVVGTSGDLIATIQFGLIVT